MCKNCRACKHVLINPSDNETSYAFSQWEEISCNHPNCNHSLKIIDYYSDPNEICEPPKWCPLISQSNKRMKKSHTEEQSIISNCKTPTTWDNIQIGKVYHMPKVFSQKRKDLLITDKTEYCITCRDINSTYYYCEYIYKSSGTYKFLVEHKLQKIEPPINCKTTSNYTYY